MNEILHTVIEAGLDKPVKILHVTDVHLTEYNSEDPESQCALLERRRETFRKEGKYPSSTTNEFFEEAIALAAKEGYLLVVSGDVIDLNSAGNRAEFARIIKGHDMMFTPGGHEYQRICKRTLHEDPPYPETAIPQVQAAFPQFNFAFESRVINGLNVITLDNALDYFPAAALEGLKKEIEKGLPIVVFMHVPLYNGYLRHTVALHPNVTMRVSEEDYRKSDEVIELIEKHPLILASFAGHDHAPRDYEREGKKHYTTGALFAGDARLIEVK